VTLFKQRKNKQFKYKPRFLKDEREDLQQDLESHWKAVKASSKRKRNIFTSLPFLVLFLIAVLVLLYLLNQYETT
jgi:type VI protein secretion system component VasF